MPWKRIPPDDSDSSSSDEPHEKRLKITWKQYLMSKRLHKPNQESQGASTSQQDMPFFKISYPNPSDVLLHHDYVGSRPGPSTSNHNSHSSIQLNEVQSIPQKWMSNGYRLYRDRNLIIDDGNDIGTFVEDSFPGNFSEIPADLSLKTPQIIVGNDDEIGEPTEDERFIDDNSSIMELPITEKQNECTSRETILKSPLRIETQDSSIKIEDPSISTEVNSIIQVESIEEKKDTQIVDVDENKLCKTDTASTHSSHQKGQSGNKSDANSNLNEVLLGLLECPVCWEVMVPPICQCARGHLLCKPCKKRLSTCPTCRASFSLNRNLAMEKVAEKLKYPCKNNGSGCNMLVLLREKKEHEANCPHRLFSCLSPYCAPRWTCKLSQLPNHYESLHSQMLLRGPTHLLKITHDFHRKPASLDWIILAFEQLFRVNIHLVPPGDVYGCVQYIGPHNCSKKYIYELKTKLSQDTYRCIMFERSTHSDLFKIEKNYVKKDSFYLPDSWTKNFKNDDFTRSVSRLEISVTVRPA